MTLGVSPITGTIYSGTVKGDIWVGKKTDVTSDFLRCVLEKAKHHGGAFEIRGGGQLFTVTVVEQEAEKELAATDLLEALKAILACVSVRIDDPRIGVFDAARAAIAKATAVSSHER